MKTCDKTQFVEYLDAFCIAYDKKISESLVNIYFFGLINLSIEQVRKAMDILIKTKKYFPRVAEFYEVFETPKDEIEKHIEIVAVEQWEQLTSDFDNGKHLKIEDLVAAKALELVGGWYSLCNCPDKEMIWRKRDFIGYYKHLFLHNKLLRPRTFFRGIYDKCETRVLRIPEIPKLILKISETNGFYIKRLIEADDDE